MRSGGICAPGVSSGPRRTCASVGPSFFCGARSWEVACKAASTCGGCGARHAPDRNNGKRHHHRADEEDAGEDHRRLLRGAQEEGCDKGRSTRHRAGASARPRPHSCLVESLPEDPHLDGGPFGETRSQSIGDSLLKELNRWTHKGRGRLGRFCASKLRLAPIRAAAALSPRHSQLARCSLALTIDCRGVVGAARGFSWPAGPRSRYPCCLRGKPAAPDVRMAAKGGYDMQIKLLTIGNSGKGAGWRCRPPAESASQATVHCRRRRQDVLAPQIRERFFQPHVYHDDWHRFQDQDGGDGWKADQAAGEAGSKGAWKNLRSSV